jgi:D-arabinose 1-dehydrogenase-like Zn-dependent alcohol dehydrogenase
MATTRGPLRLPDFSVVVWIKKNEHFAAVRSELLAAADAEPYETTEYQGMADFHFAINSMADAHTFVEALKSLAERPEVVVVRIMSLVDGIESISIKDERVIKH